MGEGMAHLGRRIVRQSACEGRRVGGRLGPVRAGPAQHPAQKARCRAAFPAACRPLRRAPHRRCRGASALPGFRPSCAADRRRRPAHAPGAVGPQRADAARPGLRGVQIVAPRSITACAWSPGRLRASVRRPAPSVRAWRPAAASERRKAGPSPARHCRRPPRRARRRRWRRWRRPYRGRCRASVSRPSRGCGNSAAMIRRPPRGRISAGCGRGRSSQAPPIRP